jgi:hypothetical protein
MSYDNVSMKHAITSLISVISSTLRGVEYLISRNNFVIIINSNYLKGNNRKRNKNYEIIRAWKCNSKILFGYSIKIKYKRGKFLMKDSHSLFSTK